MKIQEKYSELLFEIPLAETEAITQAARISLFFSSKAQNNKNRA